MKLIIENLPIAVKTCCSAITLFVLSSAISGVSIAAPLASTQTEKQPVYNTKTANATAAKVGQNNLIQSVSGTTAPTTTSFSGGVPTEIDHLRLGVDPKTKGLVTLTYTVDGVKVDFVYEPEGRVDVTAHYRLLRKIYYGSDGKVTSAAVCTYKANILVLINHYIPKDGTSFDPTKPYETGRLAKVVSTSMKSLIPGFEQIDNVKYYKPKGGSESVLSKVVRFTYYGASGGGPLSAIKYFKTDTNGNETSFTSQEEYYSYKTGYFYGPLDYYLVNTQVGSNMVGKQDFFNGSSGRLVATLDNTFPTPSPSASPIPSAYIPSSTDIKTSSKDAAGTLWTAVAKPSTANPTVYTQLILIAKSTDGQKDIQFIDLNTGHFVREFYDAKGNMTHRITVEKLGTDTTSSYIKSLKSSHLSNLDAGLNYMLRYNPNNTQLSAMITQLGGYRRRYNE